ncbi:MAG: hypothetical protein OXN89_10070 [Bryobacterales bacterium]|nr:hypothetical protein [Bryobacterales bacterium]
MPRTTEQVLTQDERDLILAGVLKTPIAGGARPPPDQGHPHLSGAVRMVLTVGSLPSKRRPLLRHQIMWRAYVNLRVQLSVLNFTKNDRGRVAFCDRGCRTAGADSVGLCEHRWGSSSGATGRVAG